MVSKSKGQVTIFIIVAIVIVVAIVVFFVLRNPSATGISKDLKPAYDYYLSCLEDTTRQGAALLGEQGGYIDVPDFVPGSQYMPFSSQLDFYGQPVPYWMYVSGNNLLKEQVPSKGDMEDELEDYIEARLDYCNLADFEMQGYNVIVHDGTVAVSIRETAIDVSIDADVVIGFGEEVVTCSWTSRRRRPSRASAACSISPSVRSTVAST